MTTATQGPELKKVDIIQAAPQAATNLAPQGQVPKGSIWLCLVPALATGLLLWMCFFPLAWGWLGWVAIVPLLALVRIDARPRRIYWCAWLGGIAFFAPILYWMPVADGRMYATWAMLTVYCAAYLPVTLALIRLLDRKTGLPLVLTVPIAWTGMEFVRSFMLTGFAWYYLGHTQHTRLSLIQIADLGGAYLVSFLVAAVNGWLFDLFYQMPALRDRFRWKEPVLPAGAGGPSAFGWLGRSGLKYEGVLLLAAFIGTLFYGTWRLEQNRFEEGPLVAMLQTNVDQRIRNQGDNPAEWEKVRALVAKHTTQLCEKALHQYPRPEIFIWPETSYQGRWMESSPKLADNMYPKGWIEDELEMRQHLSRELVRFYPVHHLLGLSTLTLDEKIKIRHFNSALHVQKDGKIAGRYDKMHRVPFGEFMPFREWVPESMRFIIDYFSPYEFDYSIQKGEKFTRFELNKYKFGVLICYEDTDPVLAPHYVRTEEEGKPVDFLVNISNDGWFDGTAEHDEHLAVSRFRAIECRRAIARSVNMGISAVIDGNGRILAPKEIPPPGEPHVWKMGDDNAELPVGEWARYKMTSGVLLAHIPLDTRESFYARAGDWLPWSCWAILGAVIIWSIIERRRNGKRQRAAHAVSG